MITFGEMLDLNRETENKIQLGGGFTTDSKYKIIFKTFKCAVFKVVIFPRWRSETWPLGVEPNIQLNELQPVFTHNDIDTTYLKCRHLHHLLVKGKDEEVLRRAQELIPSLLSHSCKYKRGNHSVTKVNNEHCFANDFFPFDLFA